MSGTLEAPAVNFGEHWQDWTVNAGYYGRVEPRKAAWVIEAITPHTEAAARRLHRLHPLITAGVEGRPVGRPTGLAAAVLSVQPGRYRLRAEQVPGGWLITEYDFRLWHFTVPDESGV